MSTRWARLRPDRRRGYPPVYHQKWFKVLDRHPEPATTTIEGYVWVETPWKIQSLPAMDLEISEKPGELELDPREVKVDVFPNAAGGIIAKATHLPTRRFRSATHEDEATARQLAVQELAQAVAAVGKPKARSRSANHSPA